jgi:site-specific recombinase XerD
MLKDLLPRAYSRYAALPVLGSIIDDYSRWLFDRGYRWGSIRLYIRVFPRLDRMLQQRGRYHLGELTHEDLRACRPGHSQDDRTLAAILTSLERYLDERQRLLPPAPKQLSPSAMPLAAYRVFLTDVRGLAAPTLQQHLRTAAQFLQQVRFETKPLALERLTDSDLEAFLKDLSRTQCRASLQHSVAQLRSFLRFLAGQHLICPGWEKRIDTPRHYRQEQLPRLLPWETVCAFLGSIDRRSPMGLRDYTLFFLMAHYGLRACDLVALSLDDLHWRQDEIHVVQRKTGYPLVLPLTDAVGNALVQYLRHGRPQTAYRQLFLRVRAPLAPLKPTAISDAFDHWWQHSGLQLPCQSPHCLRHSYAAQLLRQGVSLKAIGDLLGHRSLESTAGYLRIAREELREVALTVPTEVATHSEVTS